jgi:hypothetical protein
VAEHKFSQGKKVFVPLQFANYDYSHEEEGGPHLKDPFQLVAYLLNKDGEVNSKYFELSAWPYLNSERRIRWANQLRSGEVITDFKDPREEQLARDLYRILNFFSINPGMVIDADKTGGIQEYMTCAVSGITKLELETDKYFTHLYKDLSSSEYSRRMQKQIDIISVFRKLALRGILRDRSKIRNELVSNYDFYFDSIDGLVSNARKGVLKTFNSIYNYAGYKASKAPQEFFSESNDIDKGWGYDEAAFALGQWVRDKYENANKLTGSETQKNNDITSPQNTAIEPEFIGLEYERDIEEFWDDYFEFQAEPGYNDALINYHNALKLFDEENKHYQTNEEKTSTGTEGFHNTVKEYEKARNKLIMTIEDGFLKPHSNATIEPKENSEVLLKFMDDEGNTISSVQIERFSFNSEFDKTTRLAEHAAEESPENGAKGQVIEND